MIGVVIPVHDEEQLLGACLESVLAAAAHPRLRGEEVIVAVVLDACSDASPRIAARHGARRIRIQARNVGAARRIGAGHLAALGARWLAFTDGDTRVAADWLAEQLAADADVVCGCVTVDDWSAFHPAARRRYERDYRHRDGHCHIHGANLGLSREAYRRAGGFDRLGLDEDVALVRRLEAAGCRIAWSARPRVVTSARLRSRVRGGFADCLARYAAMPETLAAS